MNRFADQGIMSGGERLRYSGAGLEEPRSKSRQKQCLLKKATPSWTATVPPCLGATQRRCGVEHTPQPHSSQNENSAGACRLLQLQEKLYDCWTYFIDIRIYSSVVNPRLPRTVTSQIPPQCHPPTSSAPQPTASEPSPTNSAPTPPHQTLQSPPSPPVTSSP